MSDLGLNLDPAPNLFLLVLFHEVRVTITASAQPKMSEPRRPSVGHQPCPPVLAVRTSSLRSISVTCSPNSSCV